LYIDFIELHRQHNDISLVTIMALLQPPQPPRLVWISFEYNGRLDDDDTDASATAAECVKGTPPPPPQPPLEHNRKEPGLHGRVGGRVCLLLNRPPGIDANPWMYLCSAEADPTIPSAVCKTLIRQRSS
jgi:hypothetical protein